ncbi:MAG TPA: DedA family protein [Candidatus Saccharimonadales bacterium]|nr:DedA family protein [Candidatus Saccharimonadales bacterium]
MHSLLDPTHLVKTFGWIGIFVIIFLESGFVLGFFLPGDSLLFAAGLLSSQHYFNLFGVMALAAAGAILGNSAGYYTGKRAGPAIFTGRGKGLLSRRHITEAHEFFERQGGKALIFARFIPAVRTFVPIIAGIGNMNYRHFLTYNTAGGLLWAILVPILGWALGKSVHNIDKYILPVIVLIIIASALPAVYHYYKSLRKQNG